MIFDRLAASSEAGGFLVGEPAELISKWILIDLKISFVTGASVAHAARIG